MKFSKIAIFFVVFFVVSNNIFSISEIFAVQEAPCCPPSIAKLTRTIAAQLKQISNSIIYQKTRLVILAVLAILIVYVVLLILLAIKREIKATKEKSNQNSMEN